MWLYMILYGSYLILYGCYMIYTRSRPFDDHLNSQIIFGDGFLAPQPIGVAIYNTCSEADKSEGTWYDFNQISTCFYMVLMWYHMVFMWFLYDLIWFVYDVIWFHMIFICILLWLLYTYHYYHYYPYNYHYNHYFVGGASFFNFPIFWQSTFFWTINPFPVY